eukprot:TRINITY_DN1462_c0_g1_i10.p1 TRINITY_DN1462_c0_g1~~TRINITY_DN1462_c0_g1_i10.p1  ORF type:complete len:595 (-),score=75.87 TRINITY_DN1462_c0_g1_i10:958-2742(-)
MTIESARIAASALTVLLFFTLFHRNLTRSLMDIKYYDSNKENSDSFQAASAGGWSDQYNKFQHRNAGDGVNDDYIASVIVRFTSIDTIPRVKIMCDKDINKYNELAAEYGLSDETCYLGQSCDSIFEKTIIGLYGKFAMSELQTIILECFDEDEIEFVEIDSMVTKFDEEENNVDYKSQATISSSPLVYLSPQSEYYERAQQHINTIQITNRQPYNNRNDNNDDIMLQDIVSDEENVIPQVQAFSQSKNKKKAVYVSNQKDDLLDKIGEETAEFLSNMDVMLYGTDYSGEPLVEAMSKTDNEQPEYQSPTGIKSQQLLSGLWNLDRIDQQALPLNGRFNFGGENHVGTGKGVTVYVLDSGIRQTHAEFMNLPNTQTRARVGADFVDGDGEGHDCDGHGTHIASIAVGRNVGIAKEAEVVGVRVLDCLGNGPVGNVVKGLEWVSQDKTGPAVVVLSLGVDAGAWSLALEQAVVSLVQVYDITVTVASGNKASDSCQVSPANVESTITVAGSNLQSKFADLQSESDLEDTYQYSNTGACVDIFAPGVDIYGACGGQNKCGFVHDTAYVWDDGTSQAVPHVAGAVAVFLGEFPEAKP